MVPVDAAFLGPAATLSGMNLLTMRPGETPLVDVTAPYRSLTFPVLELILVTGVAWMAIGWVDTNVGDPLIHNALVILWALLALWRFVLPVYRARRRRFIVTNTRVIARTGRKVDSIPLTDISGVRRRRGGISLSIHGYERALYFPELPKTKRIENIIADELHPAWR